MEVNTDSVFLKNEVSIFQDTVRGECKTDIDSNGVTKILGIYVKCVGSEGELCENSVKYKSSVIYSICYVDSDKNVRKSECAGEISGEIMGITSNGTVRIEVKTEKTEADISSLKLIIKAVFSVNAIICEQKKSDFVTGAEDLIVRKQDCEYYRSYGKRKAVFPIEEEFTLGYAISNVLMHKITPVISAVQCGVGCIIVDGEVHISAMLLQNNEKRDIIKEEKTVPFRAEIEYEEAMPNMIALAEIGEKSFKTDVSVDEDKNCSVVKASIALSLEGEAYSVNNSVICDDAFSLSHELETQVKIEYKVKPIEQRFIPVKINLKPINVEGVENSVFVTCGYENVEITENKIVGNDFTVFGVVSYTAFFKNEEGEYITRKIESDFETTLQLNLTSEAEYSVKPKIISVTPVNFINGELNADCNLSFCVCGQESEKVKLLTSVKENGEKKAETSTISVYIPMPNEDLWSLAKRLNTPPDEICEINKDLQFPLSGKERIVVYRQKR